MTAEMKFPCPEWCTWEHHDEEEWSDNSVMHLKEFGTFSDGTSGMIRVFLICVDSKVMEKEISVTHIDMENSDDLRCLAKACLEASTWMDEILIETALV